MNSNLKEFLDKDSGLIKNMSVENEPESMMKRAKEIEDLVERMKRTEAAEKERRRT